MCLLSFLQHSSIDICDIPQSFSASIPFLYSFIKFPLRSYCIIGLDRIVILVISQSVRGSSANRQIYPPDVEFLLIQLADIPLEPCNPKASAASICDWYSAIFTPERSYCITGLLNSQSPYIQSPPGILFLHNESVFHRSPTQYFSLSAFIF